MERHRWTYRWTYGILHSVIYAVCKRCKNKSFVKITKIRLSKNLSFKFKVNRRNTRKRCETCSKLTIKKSEQRQWRYSGVFFVNFEHFSYFVLLLPKFAVHFLPVKNISSFLLQRWRIVSCAVQYVLVCLKQIDQFTVKIFHTPIRQKPQAPC